ncbi:MAG: ATP phosphoribosyltransferase [Phycisphaeraceae bacterium]|nr:ATP phosphoribosyltransferase [Phycisphaeraceae bacterium]
MTVLDKPVATATTIKFAIPKGRMFEGVRRLLADGGLDIEATERGYRPSLPLAGFGVKLLKPRAIVEMLAGGSRDVGFAGADWVRETGADLVEIVDTGLDRVRLVAAAPAALLDGGRLPDRPLVVASEYERIAQVWIEDRGLDATLLRSYGATEVLPPEDADCIIDNTATGATLVANGLVVIEELMISSTRLYASRTAMDDPAKREQVERVGLIVRSVLEARRRVMIEINVPADRLDVIVSVLPCMREPTVSALRSQSGYAVKAAVRREELAGVVPLVKQLGGTDIVVTRPEQIVP